MKTILRRPGVSGLLFAQSQVAFNDNAAKLLLIGLVQILLPKDEASRMVDTIALLLVAPFVILAPLSGWLADRFPKRHVLSASLWLQLLVTIALVVAVSLHSVILAVGGFLLLGIQASLMSPSRRGMAKELAGESIGELVGWMEMLCIAAILLGSVVGGQLIDGLAARFSDVWLAALISFVLLTLSCVAAIWGFRNVPARAGASQVPFSRTSIFGHWDLMRTLWRDKAIWRAALGDSVFYLAGGVLLLTLAEIGREMFPKGIGAARTTGIMLATIGAGVAAGSLIAARLSRRGVNLGLAPLGALGMAGAFFLLTAAAPGGVIFYAGLIALGLAGGLYLVPLGAFLVDRAPEAERGKILAASSLLSSVAGVAAVGLHAVAVKIHLGAAGQFLLLGFLMLGTAVFAAKLLPQHLLHLVALAVARTRYSVKAIGELPVTGGVLLICNHVSYVDTLILSLATSRRIRFLSYDGLFNTPMLGWILKIAGTIPVNSTRAKEAICRAADAIREGEVVCIFPEGQLTRTGCLMELKSGFELIARRAKCPIVVAHLDGLWGSIYSFEGGRYFKKLPRGLRRHATASFSRPYEKLTAVEARDEMLRLGEEPFRSRGQTPNLPLALFRALESEPFSVCLHDQSSEKKTFTSLELLTLSWRLAVRWRQSIAEERVGIILPPGIAGSAANLAVLLAGKVPVNLNPTLTVESALHCLGQSGVRTIISAQAVKDKLARFPWTDQVVLFEETLAGISKSELFTSSAQVLLLPRPLLRARLGIPAKPVREEAALLFTSGTSGQPKGVALTHGNILANFTQIAETSFLQKDDRLFSALPLFHSFGHTMGLFFPFLARIPIVTAPSPLDSDKIAEAARHGLPTILLATPTFLRSYTKRISRDAFGTLRLAVAGAERLPAETASAFHGRFGCPVLEGYGLTEASPVAALNVPNPACGAGAASVQLGHRDGSVGRLLPGLAMRLLDPETNEPAADRGLLVLRGPNIVAGYLGDSCPEKFADGWFHTGDIVRVDEEGFIFIEGRASRFSKVGGEMISHGAVEAAIAEALPGEAQDCVLGLPCPDKGERLVLLTTRRASRESLREALSGKVPNLWIPRDVINLDRLPSLASGKLNLAECKRIATLTLAAS